MEGLVEYSFITQPEWVSPAIEFTDTGIELNFPKLVCLCGESQLPSRICIILEGGSMTTAPCSAVLETVEQESKANHLQPSHNEHIQSANISSPTTRAVLEDKEIDSHSSLSPAAARQHQPAAARKRQIVKRTESVIAREIRLQKEREDGVKTERLKAMRQQRRNELRRAQAESAESSTKSYLSSGDSCEPQFLINNISSSDGSGKVPSDSMDIKLQVHTLTDKNSGQFMNPIASQTPVSEAHSSQASAAILDGVTSASKLLNAVQNRIIDEKVKRNFLSSAVKDGESSRLTKEEMFRLSDQIGPITYVDDCQHYKSLTTASSGRSAPENKTTKLVEANGDVTVANCTEKEDPRKLLNKAIQNSTIRSSRDRQLDIAPVVVTI